MGELSIETQVSISLGLMLSMQSTTLVKSHPAWADHVYSMIATTDDLGSRYIDHTA